MVVIYYCGSLEGSGPEKVSGAGTAAEGAEGGKAWCRSTGAGKAHVAGVWSVMPVRRRYSLKSRLGLNTFPSQQALQGNTGLNPGSSCIQGQVAVFQLCGMWDVSWVCT